MKTLLLLSLCLGLFACATAHKTVERSIASAAASTNSASTEKKLISTYMTDVVHFRMNKADGAGLDTAKFQADTYEFTSSEGIHFFCNPRDLQQKQLCGVGPIPVSPRGQLVIDEIAYLSNDLNEGAQKRKTFLEENIALTCRKKNEILECDLEYYGLSPRQHDEKTFSMTFAEIANLRALFPLEDRYEMQTAQSGKFVCARVKSDARDSIDCQIGETKLSWSFTVTQLASRCQNLDHPISRADCLRAGNGNGWSYKCQITNEATQEGVCDFKSNQGLYAAIRIFNAGELNKYEEMNKITTELLAQNKILSYKRLFASRSYPQFCIQLDGLAAYEEFNKIKDRYVAALSKTDKNLLWISFHKNCSSDLKDSSGSEKPGYVD